MWGWLGFGNIAIYPFGATVPGTSTINYGGFGSYSVSAGLVVGGGAANWVGLTVRNSSTHIAIDRFFHTMDVVNNYY